MKPAWDKLMKNWNKGKRLDTTLIADVDCTSEGGKALCEAQDVKGFPTIKWGDASSMETYEGGRDYDALKAFAKENLKPMCSPSNVDLCDDEKKAEIAKLEAMPLADLSSEIEQKKGEIKAAEEKFEAAVKELQAKYEQLNKEKTETIADIKKAGLGLMQAVHGKRSKASKEEL
eukprot:TRINITY_DN54442_c0_g1_i1.p2 TRINITY_DN54442_c0_g1~~TRINITY_DN54442_c0_g1_i1.p2  ORF type:complete len:174 (-),score=76.65 TRINITY_DN54442_c0_g1_i1:50-571(-)